MVGQYAGNLRRPHLRGTWNTRSFPYSPPTDRHRRWTSSHGRRAASAAPQPVRIPSGSPGLASTLVRATHGQRSTIPARQARFGQRRPSRAPTTATRPTRCANVAGPNRTDGFRDPARSAQRGCSGYGHRTPVRPDTPDHPRSHGHPSPGHQTSARPVGRTSVRMADSGRGPATTAVAGVRTSWTATTATAGWAARTSLGLQCLRRWSIHDGSAVTTPAAAVTKQLRGTARHEAAPRRIAVLGSDGWRVERIGRRHPLWQVPGAA